MNSKFIKSSIKVLFGTMHILFFVFSLLMFIGNIFISLRLGVYLSKKIIVVLFALSLYFMILSISGYFALFRKNRMVLFLYIALAIFGMNIILYSINIITRDTVVNLNNVWNKMDNSARNKIQRKLDCCGYNNVNDRKGSKCNSAIPCKLIFNQIVIQLIKRINITSITMFTMLSISLVMISFLKLKSNK
ncbi:Tetraspanin [Spraguea lophii 42_110]|uniref:Tetraspanin n=1 Tax=Spraguea lophii (strain 42_110) TaxID=1358809 RepID=S7W8G1_SPRLO|nr:Tetraspanin [Spraguea lophii 42_110]